MKAATYTEKSQPESTRIVVERAVALSKELDSKWKDADERPSERDNRPAERVADPQSTICRKS